MVKLRATIFALTNIAVTNLGRVRTVKRRHSFSLRITSYVDAGFYCYSRSLPRSNRYGWVTSTVTSHDLESCSSSDRCETGDLLRRRALPSRIQNFTAHTRDTGPWDNHNTCPSRRPSWRRTMARRSAKHLSVVGTKAGGLTDGCFAAWVKGRVPLSSPARVIYFTQ